MFLIQDSAKLFDNSKIYVYLHKIKPFKIMYRLIYIINGRNSEIVVPCAPIGVCKWKKSVLSESTHRLGTFKIEKV